MHSKTTVELECWATTGVEWDNEIVSVIITTKPKLFSNISSIYASSANDITFVNIIMFIVIEFMELILNNSSVSRESIRLKHVLIN